MPLYSLDFPESVVSDRFPSIADGSHTGLDLSADFTIEFWYKETDSVTKTDMTIVGKTNSTGTKKHPYRVYLGDGNEEIWVVAAEGSGGGATNQNRKSWAMATLDDGNWHHIAITFDANNGDEATQFELFLDTVSQGNGTTEAGDNDEVISLYNSDEDFSVGGDTDLSNDLRGARLFDIRVWSDVRTSGEISTNYLTRVGASEPGLVSNWVSGTAAESREANGDTILDRHTNSNDLPIPEVAAASVVGYAADWPPGYSAAGESDSDAYEVPFPTIYTSVINSGRAAYEAALGGTIAVTPDTTPPVISNFSPATGTELPARDTPISFDVTDLDPGLQLVVVTLKYSSLPETFVVYDGSKFVEPFNTTGSTMTAITNGYRFTVAPRTQWLGDPEFFAYAVDQAGNLEGVP